MIDTTGWDPSLHGPQRPSLWYRVKRWWRVRRWKPEDHSDCLSFLGPCNLCWEVIMSRQGRLPSAIARRLPESIRRNVSRHVWRDTGLSYMNVPEAYPGEPSCERLVRHDADCDRRGCGGCA